MKPPDESPDTDTEPGSTLSEGMSTAMAVSTDDKATKTMQALLPKVCMIASGARWGSR